MTLTSRDHNRATKTQKQDGKRKNIETIDLTNDVDDQPASKVSRSASDQSVHDGNGVSSAYLTPPLSSAPKSSQTASQRSSGYASSPTSRPGQQHSRFERDAWLVHDDDDEDWNEILNSSTQQRAEANTEQLWHYGDLPTKIVGCRYYNGFASLG